MKLTLCIAAYNEEKFISYPIESAYRIVDEIILVDGGSTDKTVEKAKSYGEKVKVFIENNPPMFHINKQKAIERASGEWILQLDADEALSEELKLEISNLLEIQSKKYDKNQLAIGSTNSRDLDSAQQSEHWREGSSGRNLSQGKYVAYYLPRKNFFLGRFLMKGGQYPDYTIRLYKKGSTHFPCKSVHENVTVKGKIGYLKNSLLHYADSQFSRYHKRWLRYIDLDANQLYSQYKVQSGESKVIKEFLNYFFIKPITTFFSIYVRHKGFMDGFPGFVFALFSSLRFIVIYVRLWQKRIF